MQAVRQDIRNIFNALQKRNQHFSRMNDLSMQSLYLSVPASVLQHKCIREFK